MTAGRVIFASAQGLFPIGHGGAESSAHDLLEALDQMGIECEAIGKIESRELSSLRANLRRLGSAIRSQSPARGGDLVEYYIPYRVTLCSDETFLQILNERLSGRRPDILLFQGRRFRDIHALIREILVPAALYVRNGFELDRFPGRHDLGMILANSKFMREKLARKYSVEATLLYPAICLDRYITQANTHQFITFINPVREKGVFPFMRMAIHMPERRFLVVEGWGTSSSVKSMLKGIPNVTYWPKQLDMRKVYARTHVLVVPSQWEESFGRVIVEAQVNGIPVVASARGGIREAAGGGAVLVPKFSGYRAFIGALLEVESRYAELSRKAKVNAARFSARNAARQFVEIVKASSGGFGGQKK